MLTLYSNFKLILQIFFIFELCDLNNKPYSIMNFLCIVKPYLVLESLVSLFYDVLLSYRPLYFHLFLLYFLVFRA